MNASWKTLIGNEIVQFSLWRKFLSVFSVRHSSRNYQWSRYQHDRTDIAYWISKLHAGFYIKNKMVIDYDIILECSVKDFIMNIHLRYLCALNLLQAKKKRKEKKGGCNMYKICILCIVVDYTLEIDIQWI